MGDITEAVENGTVAADGQSAMAYTDEDGVSCVTIYSEQTGYTRVIATATYPENPYPQMLIDRDTIDGNWDADEDWEEQHGELVMPPWPPDYDDDEAQALKKWIPHVIDDDTMLPIEAQNDVDNVGEVEEFVLTLEDVFGNPIEGYTVMWWIQGVGEFKTDDSSWSGVGEQNKDWDLTDEDGLASVWVKSLYPGETIIHVKVVDKYGHDYKEWNITQQWYRIDDVRFWEYDELLGYWVPDDGAINDVATDHTFDLLVAGAKYVHTLYDINGNGLRTIRF